MYEKIVGHRQRYGANCLTIFPDGTEIPWRQLNLQEFLNYDELFRSGRYVSVDIEDEIFRLAVLEPLYVDNIDILPAGSVATVVSQILQVSGASSPEQIENDLNIARSEIQDFVSSAITMICSVFPAYTPEDVCKLNYDLFVRRLAMAEKRLFELGILKEPITVMSSGQEVPRSAPVQELPSQRKRREMAEARHAALEKKMGNLNSKSVEGIITKDQMSDSLLTYVPDLSQDPGDRLINKKKMDEVKSSALSGLEHIYPEYFKMLKEGKKITPESIQEIKGKSSDEVRAKHSIYSEKLKSGEIKPPPIVTDKLPNKNFPAKKQERVKVRRQ